MAARNMQRIEINIYEKEIVSKVGYLQETNRDARSTEHKKYRINSRVNMSFYIQMKYFADRKL